MSSKRQLLRVTAHLVGTYISKNSATADELTALIPNIYKALLAVDAGAEGEDVDPPLTPAQIQRSITPDALISFVDGKPYKTLKRHLSAEGLSFAEYKSLFGLPSDYPSTAPNHSARRSALAKERGLGKSIGRVRGASVARNAVEPQ